VIEGKIENSLNKETLLSSDLINMHAEDEADLLFEVTVELEP